MRLNIKFEFLKDVKFLESFQIDCVGELQFNVKTPEVKIQIRNALNFKFLKSVNFQILQNPLIFKFWKTVNFEILKNR